jgi:hypothetical protein
MNGKMINANRILVRKPLEKTPLGRYKMDHKGIRREVKWIKMNQDRVQRRAFVIAAMSL